MLENAKKFYKTKKILLFIIISIWLILTILSGVLLAFYSKPDIIPLTPEEENLKGISIIQDDEEKILKGKMLSTKYNLSFDDLKYSRNYIERRKSNNNF